MTSQSEMIEGGWRSPNPETLKPTGEARNLQKICDVYDYFNADFLRVIRDDLHTSPSLRRRAWEFATIILALERRRMLDGTKIGLGLGVGTEKLIFALAPLVKRAIVTDLYQPDSRWTGVRTDNPTEFLRSKAPWAVDWERLDVRRMDMREIELTDDSIDFSWSTGSIEHIGDDEEFVRHFREVHRVLRPGGVYVLTTAIAFRPETIRFPGNYLFNPHHLLGLAEESGLHAEPVFDCSLESHTLNQPAIEDPTEFGFNQPRQDYPHLISYRRGVITTANCLILTKWDGVPTPAVISGFSETSQRLHEQAERLRRSIWRTWQNVRVDLSDQSARTPFFHFGARTMKIRVECRDPDSAGTRVKLVSRDAVPPLSRKVERAIELNGSPVEFSIKSDAGRIYQVVADRRSEITVAARIS